MPPRRNLAASLVNLPRVPYACQQIAEWAGSAGIAQLSAKNLHLFSGVWLFESHQVHQIPLSDLGPHDSRHPRQAAPLRGTVGGGHDTSNHQLYS